MPPTSRGYLRALVGSFVGGSVLGIAIGSAMFLIPCENDGFKCLGVAVLALLAAAAGFAVGAAVGCYLALRRAHAAAGRTAIALFVLEVVISGVLVALSRGGIFDAVVSFAVLLMPVALPLVARRIALVGLKSDGSSDIVGTSLT